MFDHRVFKLPQYLSDGDPDNLVRSLKTNASKSPSFPTLESEDRKEGLNSTDGYLG